MKLCLCCKNQAHNYAEACLFCGEASFSEATSDAQAQSSEGDEKKPKRARRGQAQSTEGES